MNSEWTVKTVEEIAAPEPRSLAMGPFGSNIKTDIFVTGGVPVIRGSNLTSERFNDDGFVYLTEQKADELRGSNAFPADIVFTHRGTLGQVGIIPPDAKYRRYVISQSQMKLTCNHDLVDPLYVFYFFKSRFGQHALLSNTSTTGVPAISRPLTSLRQIEIPVPPLPQQRAIAHILGTLDDKIELNRRMNETLEAIARALFKSWFVDFDPVRAKMEGRQPPGMDADTASLFPDSLVDSELGLIPDGWTVGSLGGVADVNWGDTNTTKRSYTPTGFTAYSAKGPDGRLPYHDYSRPGVVLSAIGANSGTTWLATGEWSCIKNTIRFWATDHALVTEYLYHATLGKDKWPLRGSAQPFISQGDARSLRLLIPARKLALQFGNVVRPFYAQIAASDQLSQNLASLRDTLLPKLMSGEMLPSLYQAVLEDKTS